MAVLNTLTYMQPRGVFQHVWPRVFVFVVFARGWFDLVCWFWVNFDNESNGMDSSSRRSFWQGSMSGPMSRFARPSARNLRLTPGVNVALQREMTGYILCL